MLISPLPSLERQTATIRRMVTKNPTLMQALFLKKTLKINNLYMYKMFRCELYQYCIVLLEFADYFLDGFGKKKKLAWTGITKWAPASGKGKGAEPRGNQGGIIVSYLSN
jgi:hypothetical protein